MYFRQRPKSADNAIGPQPGCRFHNPHERTRGSKLEGTFRKTNAKIVDETRHTITILPESGKKVIVSKKDVAIRRNDEAKSQKKKEKKYHKKRQSAQKWQLREDSTSDEISQPMGIANYSGTSESETKEKI